MTLARVFLSTCAALLLGGQSLVQAQLESYEGKTIEIVVGFTSGGFYDRWSRLLARYVPNNLPGHPEIIVQNMPARAA